MYWVYIYKVHGSETDISADVLAIDRHLSQATSGETRGDLECYNELLRRSSTGSGDEQ